MDGIQANPRSFAFVAVKPAGGRTIGVRQALDERSLSDALRRDRLILLQSWRLPGWTQTQRELRLKDQAILNDQLAQLLGRGVPLVEALEVTAATVSTKARPTIERIRDLVAAGSAFSDACVEAGAIDTVTAAVYRSAEKTGELGDASHQLAVNARRRLAIAGKAVTLLIYPMIVLTISVLVSVVILTLIVPQIAESMVELGVDLPWYTEVVVTVGVGLKTNALIVSGVVALVIVACVLFRGAIGSMGRWLMRHTPLLRDVVLAQESARFFSVMAAMTKSGIPLAEALGVANQAVGHAALRRQLTTLRDRLIEGGMLRVLIEDATALPLATRKLLIAAERSGDLDTAFDTQASDLADEVDRRSSRLLSALEPLLIVMMFTVIGSLIMSIMVPLITLTSRTIQ